MDVVNLRWREAVQLEAGIFCAQRPQQVLVPLNAEIGVQSALHQNASAAERNRLVDLFANCVDRLHVGIRRAGPPIKRTERADDVADVRVIDVSVDDVSDYVGGMLALANLVRRRSDFGNLVGFKKRRAVFRRQSLTIKHAIKNWLNIRFGHGCSLFSCPAIVQPTATDSSKRLAIDLAVLATGAISNYTCAP